MESFFFNFRSGILKTKNLTDKQSCTLDNRIAKLIIRGRYSTKESSNYWFLITIQLGLTETVEKSNG